MELADSLDDLTADWLTGALREGGVLDGDASVSNADVALFGTGQFGLVARAELAYSGEAGDAPASVIVKLPSNDPGSRQLGIMIGAYEAEVRFYDEIAPRTEVAVPRCYWGGFEPGTGRVTLVIEDLSEDWTVGDAIAGGSVEQAEAAIDQTIRLQASLWDVPELRRARLARGARPHAAALRRYAGGDAPVQGALRRATGSGAHGGRGAPRAEGERVSREGLD